MSQWAERCAARTRIQIRKMLAMKAIVGWVQRQRTSHPLLRREILQPTRTQSEVAGKSVSPSAASEPVTPTISTTTDAGDRAEGRDKANGGRGDIPCCGSASER